MNTTPSVSGAQSVYAGSSREDTQSTKKLQLRKKLRQNKYLVLKGQVLV